LFREIFAGRYEFLDFQTNGWFHASIGNMATRRTMLVKSRGGGATPFLTRWWARACWQCEADVDDMGKDLMGHSI
jgi:hypothetical protein